MKDKGDFLEKLQEHFEKCAKESINNPSANKKKEKNIIFWDMYEDQLWLDYCFDNMTEEEHANLRKLLSAEGTSSIAIQTKEGLEEFYGKEKIREFPKKYQ